MRLIKRVKSAEKKSHELVQSAVMPKHVAIIMDGNGRWAKSRKLPRTAGHRKGAESLRTILNSCRDHGIKHLTIYAFSSENWRRPVEEINDLMQLLVQYLEKELQELHQNNIRLRFIGDVSKLKPAIRSKIDAATTLTQNNDDFHFTIALSYGSQQELTRAMQKIAQKVASGELSPDAITENDIENALDTYGLPAPDLLIRTGGEQRLSNFLLWQAAYSEFYFTDTLWPDFDDASFKEALRIYATRNRRFGTTGEPDNDASQYQ